MRLSTAGRYALRAMVDLARHDGDGPVLRRDIAQRQELSSDYLAQLFVKLKRDGLVDSVMGPGGGYVLARPAVEIRASDVLRAVDESLRLTRCLEEGQAEPCPRMAKCVTRVLWERMGRAMIDVLDSVTLAELCAMKEDWESGLSISESKELEVYG
jgi:Rrf2 family iron-sulfur cluster assembly transcriptional regulator